MSNFRRFLNSAPDRGKTLERAVRATRRTSASPVLSDDVRARILEQAIRDGSREPLPSLFVPVRRLLAAGAVPLALTAVLLTAVRAPEAPIGPDPTRVEVSKEDGQIVFRIANGKPFHDVYRSAAPDEFEQSSRVRVTDGAFSDVLKDREGVVFYRID